MKKYQFLNIINVLILISIFYQNCTYEDNQIIEVKIENTLANLKGQSNLLNQYEDEELSIKFVVSGGDYMQIGAKDVKRFYFKDDKLKGITLENDYFTSLIRLNEQGYEHYDYLRSISIMIDTNVVYKINWMGVSSSIIASNWAMPLYSKSQDENYIVFPICGLRNYDSYGCEIDSLKNIELIKSIKKTNKFFHYPNIECKDCVWLTKLNSNNQRLRNELLNNNKVNSITFYPIKQKSNSVIIQRKKNPMVIMNHWKNTTIDIYNFKGKKVDTIIPNNYWIKLNPLKFNSGVYIVQVQNDDFNEKHRLIIKNN